MSLTHLYHVRNRADTCLTITITAYKILKRLEKQGELPFISLIISAQSNTTYIVRRLLGYGFISKRNGRLNNEPHMRALYSLTDLGRKVIEVLDLLPQP